MIGGHVMKIVVETISPVHIGAGERYSSSEFIVKGNKIIMVDINKIYTLLNEKNKEIFIEYLEEPRFSITEFINKINLPLSEAKLYFSTLKTNIPTEIIGNVKTGYKGYIPGSSLKGAIRTAILSGFIGKKEVMEIGRIFTNKNQWQRERELEASMDSFFSTGKGQSSYFDFMRFVQISDFIPVNNLTVYNVQSLEVIEKDGWDWYSRNGRVVQSYLETIATGEHLEGDIKVTYNEKLYQSLGLKGKGAILDIDEIKRLVYGLSYNIIEHEIDFSKFYGIDFLQNFYVNLKNINNVSSPVIKLGQGSGFLATTIGLEIKKYPDVYDEVRKSTRGRSYGFEFPKTRKIVVEEKMPLGWCRII